ncbi:MAG: transglycosylase domain-containing protein [Bdellovibrionales bacterium]
MQSKLRIISIIFAAIVLLGTMILGSWGLHLNQIISQSLEKRSLTPIREYFAQGEQIFVLQNLNDEAFIKLLRSYKLGKVRFGKLRDDEYQRFYGDQCLLRTELDKTPENLVSCVEFKLKSEESELFYFVGFDSEKVIFIEDKSTQLPVTLLELPPQLFAQYHGQKPILRRPMQLSETPAVCINSVVAIEDPNFLEHQGFSIKSILRALIKNIQLGRKAQGGSTITQQLVKNYFLTHEKTYSRKIKELIMSVIVEYRMTKDEILEAYMNEIYMAQNGVFEVRGFGAASEHYFGKEISELAFPECALLAAILNSPGRFDPFTKPENALNRRNRVIEKLGEMGIIDAKQLKSSLEFPLPNKNKKVALQPAPYFIDAVKNQMSALEMPENESLKIYTTLNLRSQKAARASIQNGITGLEKWYKSLKDIKATGKNLQAAIITADPTNGYITSLIGGRSYITSPYNRALFAKRQVGSIMKPFVYLSALENIDDETGLYYNPRTQLVDQEITYEYDDQKWTPQNYDKEYRGKVPLFYALKSSLNAATANLALKNDLNNVIDIANRLGIKSKIEALPSLSLGAYELSLKEVLQAYASLARLGEKVELSVIAKVKNQKGDLLFEHKISRQQVVAKETTSILVGMLKQTVKNGTGRVVSKMGFNHPAAGKTGTTSNYKDAWFGGFTPLHVAVVWVGYDDNTPHGLSGASGAAPIWTNYMKSFAGLYPKIDFAWSEATEIQRLSPIEQKDLNVPDPIEELEDIELIFRK